MRISDWSSDVCSSDLDAAHWPLWPISWTPLWVYLLLCCVPDCVPGRRGRTASGGTASDKTGPGRTCPGRTGRRPVGPGEIGRMDFERFFAKEMAGLKAAGRYDIFSDLERRADSFPHATQHVS